MNHTSEIIPYENTPELLSEQVFVFPASFHQQRLWFLDKLEPGSSSYNIPFAIRLSGNLNVGVLEQSFQELIRRHEVLRTVFSADDKGAAIQLVSASHEFHLGIIDLDHHPADSREQQAQQLLMEQARKPFDLARGPLLRAHLLRLATEEHILVLTVHHAVFDGWSLGILLREVSALYQAFLSGKPSPLPDLSLQYGDFAAWQREWLGSGDRIEKLVSYWKQHLAGAPALLDLPTDFPRPALQTYRGETLSLVLPKSFLEELNNLAVAERSTLFMILLAAFDVLLARYSNQQDVVVGTYIAGRNRSELEALIGFFVNTLALRMDLSGNPTFHQLLARVRESALGAYAHQDLPFEKLVEELQPQRNMSHAPVFQATLMLQNIPQASLELPGLRVSSVEINTGTAKVDLGLSAQVRADGLQLSMTYNVDLFRADTISRMLRHFQRLLEGIVADANLPIAELPLLTERERHSLLVEFNRPATDYPAASIHQLFEQQVRQTPNQVALRFGRESLTYIELNRRANQLARYLEKHGVGPEMLIGLYLERSVDMMVALLGTLKVGAAYVPLDPAYPKNRIAFIVEDAQIPLLLTQQHLVESLPKQAAALIRLDEDWKAIAAESSEDLSLTVRPENLAYVLYTSGSTGKPKGVAIEHRNVVNFLESMRREPGLTKDDVLLAVTTLSFDIAGLELYLPLITGAQVVMASREEASDGKQLLERMESCRPTVMQATPATWRLLLEAGWQGSPMLKILCGGEALPRELAEQLRPRCRELWNMYGPTETTIWSTTHRVGESETGTVPIGRPIANTETYVLDANLQPVPVGVAGELYIGGHGLARGYLNRPELTAEKFLTHSFGIKPDLRLYKTGDLVRYRLEGGLIYLGRIDNQVKVRGFRIELGEIESVLSEHRGIEQSVVMAREDEPGNQQLVAYVIPDPKYRDVQEQSRTELAREHWQQWEAARDATYQQTGPAAEGTFNLAGWHSSYTGLPIPQEEMREWVDSTVDRIRALGPKRVLEIGCGTGLLLFRVAPYAKQYWAVDSSHAALDYVRQQLGEGQEKLPPITLARKAMDDFSGFEPGGFDTVVVNSVVQYFPGVDSFLKTLERAIEAVENGGVIFLGDIRSHSLLKAFHTAVELHQAPASLPAKELWRRVQLKVEQEEELFIDPALFLALEKGLPRISSVEILLKGGRYHNQLTQFRYDVILHVGNRPQPSVDCEWLDWQKQGLTLAEIRQILEESHPDMLGVTQIPNARVGQAVAAWKKLEAGAAPDTAGELRTLLRDGAGALVEPADLWQLGRELGYSASLAWSGSGWEETCDVVFRRAGTAWAVPRIPRDKVPTRPWSTYANDPLKGAAARNLVPQLRQWLTERLPAYMVPSAYVVLNAFPLTPNGKVDRRSLPRPEFTRPGKSVAPRDEVEKSLVEIWQKLLGVQPIGVKDNFFELGGHSMLAVRLMTEIQKATGKLIPLATLFQGATVESLANVLRQEAKPAHQMVVEIQGGGSKPPFFAIVTPGVNALGYVALARQLGEDQPFYEIQGPGRRLSATEGRPYTAAEFENLAAEYIQAMKTIQPRGPYHFGGMCEGARIAFDMARLLEAGDDAVGLLAIIDTWVLENSQIRFLWKIDYYSGRLKGFWGLSLTEKWKTLRKWLPHSTKRSDSGGNGSRSLWPAAYWPGENFVPAKFGGKITVFKVPKQPYYYVRDPSMGWGTRTTAGVELQFVPLETFKHRLLLREPHVRQFAQKLADCLRRARTQSSELPTMPAALTQSAPAPSKPTRMIS